MPFAIGWKPPAEAEGTCVEVSEVPDDEVVEIGVDTAVLDPVVLDTVVIDTALLLGGRPGVLRGMHVAVRWRWLRKKFPFPLAPTRTRVQADLQRHAQKMVLAYAVPLIIPFSSYLGIPKPIVQKVGI